MRGKVIGILQYIKYKTKLRDVFVRLYKEGVGVYSHPKYLLLHDLKILLLNCERRDFLLKLYNTIYKTIMRFVFARQFHNNLHKDTSWPPV